MNVHDIPSPALVVEAAAFQRNVTTMGAVRPGRRLRPHVKAFKSTALARELVGAGHDTFCCATVREMEGMAAAAVGTDLLLANEVVGDGARRLGALARAVGEQCLITGAVDSAATVEALAQAGVRQVVVDVNVGLPRCGCDPQDAGEIAELARSAGLEVRGVMGYEGHLMRVPAVDKPAEVEASMRLLLAAHRDVGGPLLTGGGTGTYDCNPWLDEIQAGSYCLMDTEYVEHAPAFEIALSILGTCISVSRRAAVIDVGLKALGMDHGNPTIDGATCLFVSDEHTTIVPIDDGPALPQVGDRVRVWPAHIDPTVAYHERMYVVDGGSVIDVWPIDLRHW
jgi:D-serine deaminase-like pyridoxal phosphate-dependent protein